MGINFPHPVGLAAGFDKSAECSDALHNLGFAFVEVGTLTPQPQPGNPHPRLFRLKQQQAIINRMGFNNKGIQYALYQLKKRKTTGILGINISKNHNTPLQQASNDYQLCLNACYPIADYVAINISSPNTEGLRSLQHGADLERLLTTLKQDQQRLHKEHNRYVPIAIKIAPDLSETELQQASQTILNSGMDAIIATNTTLSRTGIEASQHANEPGGLSGAPLTTLSTQTIKQLKSHLGNKLPIIAAGGIMTPTDAQNKLQAGADLLQLYTGFIYHGPQLIQDILLAIQNKQNNP